MGNSCGQTKRKGKNDSKINESGKGNSEIKNPAQPDKDEEELKRVLEESRKQEEERQEKIRKENERKERERREAEEEAERKRKQKEEEEEEERKRLELEEQQKEEEQKVPEVQKEKRKYVKDLIKDKRPLVERGRPHSSLIDPQAVLDNYSYRYSDQNLFNSKEHEKIDLNKVDFIQRLYVDKVEGEVWKVYDKEKNAYIHVKIILLKPEIDVTEQRKLEDLEIELKIYNHIKRDYHPNICNLIGISDELFENQDRIIYIKTEGGLCCLHDMLETRIDSLNEETDFPYEEKEIMLIALQVSEGVLELKKRSIAHRNLHSYNLILNNDMNAYQIAQMTVASVENEYVLEHSIVTEKFGGHERYMAPEVAKAFQSNNPKLKYNPYHSDMYSLGITLLELMGVSESEISRVKLRGDSEKVKLCEDWREHYELLMDVVSRMLEKDPQKRITFEELRDILVGFVSEDFTLSEINYKKIYEAKSTIDKQSLDEQIEHYKNVFEIYKRARKWERVIDLLNKLLGLIKNKYGNYENEEGEDAIFNLGLAYYSLGISDKAEKFLKRNLEFCSKLAGSEIDSCDRIKENIKLNHLVRIYENMGAFNDNQEKFAEAMEYYEKALELREKMRDNDIEKARLYNSMGMCFYNKQYYKGAKDYLEKSLKLFTKLYNGDEKKQMISNILNNLGLTYYQLGDLNSAMRNFLKEVEIKTFLLKSDEHEELAASYNNIGLVYSQLQNFSEAIRYYNLSLEIKRKKLQPNDISIAKTLHNLADRHYLLKEFDQAIKYFQEALYIKENYRKSQSHPDLCTTINAIGLIYLEKDEIDKALDHFLQSKEILEKNFPAMEHHPLTATTYNNLGEVYNRKRDVENAKKYVQMAVDILGKDEENSHMDMSVSMYNLGSLYQQAGDKEKARQAYQKALDIALELAGGDENDPQVKEIREEMAKI